MIPMNIRLRFIAFYILITSLFNCQQAPFTYKKEPKSLLNLYESRKSDNNEADKIVYYDLTLSLPKNYSKKGNVDYTDIIQEVLRKKENVKFPDFPLLINSKGLFIKDNSKLFFQPNSLIIVKPDERPKNDIQNIKDWYDIIRVYKVQNVTIFNPKIIGDRIKHVGEKGEWGAGIGIRNSKNIAVYNANIKNTWGEGIFIGSEDGGFCENISIKNAQIDYARRNGIAITSGKNIFLENILVTNIFGTNPMFGIDIEPSWYKDIIENVNLKDIITFNNRNGGIYVVLYGLSTDDPQYKKNVTINIDNHFDESSPYAFGFLNNKDKKKYDPIGNINIKNGNWKSDKNQFIDSQNDTRQIKLNIQNIVTERTDNKQKKILNRKNF